MSAIIIRNVSLVNEGKITRTDLLIKDERIERIDSGFDVLYLAEEINGENLHLMPGIIDDQVHFREPGLTHKADLYSESRAAAAGGVTSFMEMPNTNPPAVTNQLLEDKYILASRKSLVNYSFFLGTTNNNLDELLRVDKKNVCGIKIFMGSSTGNMLVDSPSALEAAFSQCDTLIATHCEDDQLVKLRLEHAKAKYGSDIPMWMHPVIRNEEVCLNSSQYAHDLALKHDTRLHILHISTKDELKLFRNDIPLDKKRITSEACVHHLWFDASAYETLGSKIKCNPAIKDASHKPEILKAVLDDRIDVIATDHAPHTVEEKNNSYEKAPSGLPLVQHTLNIMLQLHFQGKISLEKIVEKMCHNPAVLFQIIDRGFVREGYFADLVLFQPNNPWIVNPDSLLYKCGWSPFENTTFNGKVITTFANGNKVYDQGKIVEGTLGRRLKFNR